MSCALAILRRDLLRIIKNPVALLVALGLAIVPCLYAWLNVAANWDPYANTSDLLVAVVNEDVPATVGSMGELCIGDKVAEKLAQNERIGWVFTDREQALEGVRSATYYAAIVIEPDFTSSLAATLDGHRDKARLTYYVNEKANAVAPKVTDTGAQTIENEIDEQFVAVVSGVVVERLQEALGTVSGKVDTAITDAGDVLAEVTGSLADVDSDLANLIDSLDRTVASLTSAAETLSGLEGAGARGAERLDQALVQLTDARGKASAFVSDLNEALGTGERKVSSLSSVAAIDISTIAGELAYVQTQVNAAIATLEGDLTDTQALEVKVGNARSATAQITTADGDVTLLTSEVDRELERGASLLVQISDDQAAKLDELRALAGRIEAAADEARHLSTTLDTSVQSAVGRLASVQGTAAEVASGHLSAAFDSFAQVAYQLKSAMLLADPIVSQTRTLTEQLASALSQTSESLAATRASLAEAKADIEGIAAEVDGVRASATWGLLNDLPGIDAESVRSFMEAPVDMDEVRLYPVKNYATGVAPFFTSLSLWVAGIAFVAIIKLEVDEEGVGHVRPWQAYIGRWLLLSLLGIVQAIVCCAGNLAIGIQCVHPWAYYLSAVVSSFVFVSIIFSLSSAFKHVGKALAFTLVILQVPGSSGTYPIEMMPPFFRAIGPWLPFTYSNNAMREALAGLYGTDLATDLGMLALYVVPSLLIGVTARSHLMNVNALVDRRLRETDHLMVYEAAGELAGRFRLETLVKAIHEPTDYQEAVEERSARFLRIYPVLVRRAMRAFVIVPAVLFVVMMLTGRRLETLGALVVALALIASLIVVIEYLRYRASAKRALMELPPEELEELLNEALREELLAYAPIDRILARKAGRLERDVARQAKGAAHMRQVQDVPAGDGQEQRGGEGQ